MAPSALRASGLLRRQVMTGAGWLSGRGRRGQRGRGGCRRRRAAPRTPRALLTGRLLPPAQLRELLATIPVHDTGELFAEHYGLGIYRVQLPCGTAWGHDGGWPGGFKTFACTRPDGARQAVMVYNDFKMSISRRDGGTGTAAFQRDVRKATEIAFCGRG